MKTCPVLLAGFHGWNLTLSSITPLSTFSAPFAVFRFYCSPKHKLWFLLSLPLQYYFHNHRLTVADACAKLLNKCVDITTCMFFAVLSNFWLPTFSLSFHSRVCVCVVFTLVQHPNLCLLYYMIVYGPLYERNDSPTSVTVGTDCVFILHFLVCCRT